MREEKRCYCPGERSSARIYTNSFSLSLFFPSSPIRFPFSHGVERTCCIASSSSSFQVLPPPGKVISSFHLSRWETLTCAGRDLLQQRLCARADVVAAAVVPPLLLLLLLLLLRHAEVHGRLRAGARPKVDLLRRRRLGGSGRGAVAAAAPVGAPSSSSSSPAGHAHVHGGGVRGPGDGGRSHLRLLLWRDRSANCKHQEEMQLPQHIPVQNVL